MRLFNIFMAVFVALMFSVTGIAYAQKTVTASDTEGEPGATGVIVPITVDDAEGIAGIDITLTYDPDVLTATGAETTPLTEGFSLQVNTENPGQILICMGKATAIPEGSGALVNIIFNVKEDVCPGKTSPLNFSFEGDLPCALHNEEGGDIEANWEDGTFTVSGGHTLSGKVIDAETGEGVGGIYVEWDLDVEDGCEGNTETGPDGTFTFSNVPEGVIELIAKPDFDSGYAQSYKEFYLSDDTSNLVLKLKKGAAVFGFVWDSSGNGINNLDICANGINTESSTNTHFEEGPGDGFYKMRLAPGIYNISIDEDDYISVNHPDVVIDDVSKVYIFNFIAYPVGSEELVSIQGKVSNPDNFSVNGSFMIVAFKAGTEINEDNIGIIEPIAETIPDDDGNYTLNLPPGESYDIYFLCGMEGEDNSGSYTLRGMSLDVFPPANDINFTYDSEGGEVTGKIENTGSSPVFGGYVTLKDGDDFIGFAKTDHNGNYHLYNVPQGTYKAISSEGHLGIKSYSGEVTVTDGEVTENIDITYNIASDAPDAPLGLKVYSADGHVHLEWLSNSEKGTTGYKIYRSETPSGPFTERRELNADTLSYDDPADNGTTYYYYVTALGSESGNFSPKEVTPQDDEEIRNLLNNLEEDFEAEDHDKVLSYFSQNYLNDGNDYASMDAELQELFDNYHNFTMEFTIYDIWFDGDRAIVNALMQFSRVADSDGLSEVEWEIKDYYLINEEGNWHLYGNQKIADSKITSTHHQGSDIWGMHLATLSKSRNLDSVIAISPDGDTYELTWNEDEEEFSYDEIFDGVQTPSQGRWNFLVKDENGNMQVIDRVYSGETLDIPTGITVHQLPNGDLEVSWDYITEGNPQYEVEVIGDGFYLVRSQIPINSYTFTNPGLVGGNQYTVLINADRYTIDNVEVAESTGRLDFTAGVNLNISKEDNPDPVGAGSNLTYTITYQNLGIQDTTGVMIKDTIPEHTAFVSATEGGTLQDNEVIWNIGDLNAGESGTVEFTVKIDEGTADGTLIHNDNYNINCDQIEEPVYGEDVTTTVSNQPILNVNPIELDFGTTQTKKDFEITNIGTGVLNWFIGEIIYHQGDGWITSVTPDSGTTTAETDTVSVTISRAGLDPGEYSATIPVLQGAPMSLNGGGTNVEVTMEVPEEPVLNVTPTSLDFGSTETEMTFDITNAGTGTLSWDVTPQQSWISVNPTSGETTTETDTITVTVDRTGLAPGHHTGTVSVSSNGGDQDVTVEVDVSGLGVNPTNLDFGTSDLVKTFNITNTGSGALNWNIGEVVYHQGNGWITSVIPNSGTTTTETDTVTVTINRQGLDAGAYTATIPVSSNGGNQNISVQMEVEALTQPQLQISPDDISPTSGNVYLTPTLVITNFAELGYAPVGARWYLWDSDTGDTVLQIPGEEAESEWDADNISQLTIPDGILKPSGDSGHYLAKIILQDSSTTTAESNDLEFNTVSLEETDDQDNNGVPDDEELSDTEINQYFNEHPEADTALVEVASGDSNIIGMDIDKGKVTRVDSIDPDELPDKPANYNFPYGLFTVRIEGLEEGERVLITFILPEAYFGSWYKYDEVNGWYDYSDHVVEYNGPEKKVTIEVKDGGYGDADGVENGVIVDPSGPGSSTGGGEGGGGGGGGGGCFISTLGRH
ncbi:DUF11 domain-containing protein [Candidatus Calescamantes bacterium]|nr:DUF11 domain-containing protein [Candidatus Calescamantes bacterium]